MLGFIRFSKYVGVGFSTFIFDLFLFYILTSWIGIQYLLATVLAFSISVSINYGISRRYVFRETDRGVVAGYSYFLLIGGSSLVAVTLLMAICVEILDLPYLISRIFVSGAVGIGTYLMNLYLNFRVAGKHAHDESSPQEKN